MSWREHWNPARSSVVAGDVISGCRDNDTHTYRLFVNKNWRDVEHGHQISGCMCCDLSIEDLRFLADMLNRVVVAHEPWPEPDEEDAAREQGV